MRQSGPDFQLHLHGLGCVWNGDFSFPLHMQAHVHPSVPLVSLENALSIVNCIFPKSSKIIISSSHYFYAF